MDARRVIMKLDELNIAGKEKEGAELLERWREDARCEGDFKAELTILSEMLGQYRKLEDAGKGLKACEDAIAMVSDQGIEETATGATILVNAATTLKTFGKAEESLSLFEKCENTFKKTLEKGDYRMSALYNNMALTLSDLGDFEKAERYFRNALKELEDIDNSDCDRASTYCNLAELYDRYSKGEEKVNDAMEKAYCCLKEARRDSYLAYTLTRCIPTFDYFGFFIYCAELKKLLSELTNDIS